MPLSRNVLIATRAALIGAPSAIQDGAAPARRSSPDGYAQNALTGEEGANGPASDDDAYVKGLRDGAAEKGER
jgi:hypothetical protein